MQYIYFHEIPTFHDANLGLFMKQRCYLKNDKWVENDMRHLLKKKMHKVHVHNQWKIPPAMHKPAQSQTKLYT